MSYWAARNGLLQRCEVALADEGGVTVEQSIGEHIRIRLNQMGMTQEAFGRALAPYLGRTLSKSAVSVALSGGRSFVASELVAMALVLRVSPDWMFAPLERCAACSGAGVLPAARLPETRRKG